MTVKRTTQALLKFCNEGFDAILSACIENQDFYGGTYTRGNETYIISDNAYPDSPIVFTTTATPTPTPPANPTVTLNSGDSQPPATCGAGAFFKDFTFPVSIGVAGNVASLEIILPVADVQ